MNIPALWVRDISKFFSVYIKYEVSKNSSTTSSVGLLREFNLSSEGKKKQLIDQLIAQVVSQLIAGALDDKK